MLIDKYYKYILKINKVYFANEEIRTNADIIKYIQYLGTSKNKNGEYFYTSIIDLNQPETKIKSSIRKNYLHRINQAKKKFAIKSTYIRNPSLSEINNFIIQYNKISASKGYQTLEKDDYLRIKNNIIISYAKYLSNNVCGHLYIYDDKRLRQLNSFIINDLYSENIKNISSAANKYLHYSDIIFAKKNGFRIFDLGGLFNIDSSAKGITIFKLGFSNKIERTFNFYKANSKVGEIILVFQKYLNSTTLLKVGFFLRIIFLTYLRNLVFYKTSSRKSELLSEFNDLFLEFYNISDILRHVSIYKYNKLFLVGSKTGIPFLILNNLKFVLMRLLVNNSKEKKNLESISIKYNLPDSKILISSINEFDILEAFNLYIINRIDITIDDLRILLGKITKNKNYNKESVVVYLNPIYNHIMEEYNLYLIKDINSVLNTRIHVYSNSKDIKLR